MSTRTEIRRLLTTSEVALMFRVDPKTVTRWGNSGRLSSIRTPGGHRRYDAEECEQLLNGTRVVRDDSR